MCNMIIVARESTISFLAAGESGVSFFKAANLRRLEV